MNWSKGKLFFINCPSQCGLEFTGLCVGSTSSQHPSASDSPSPLEDDLGPDADLSRSIFDFDSDKDTISSWNLTLQHELGPEDEALLYVDVSSCVHPDSGLPKDIRISDHLRLAKENCDGIDRYLKEFAPVFSQSGFDDLPPRRSWDHAIELKPSEENKPISSKVYALSRPEQIELDKFLDNHLKTGRIRPSKSPIASPFFFVKKKDGSLRPVQDYR